ncbi:MAG: PAS domain S-box protein [Bacteroidota bacterium]|nr:PAS domain S-box protein [Bacteroidota bacterium]
MDFTGRTILVVEDEAIIAMTEKLCLQKEGYLVRHVFRGEDAVKTVNENPDQIDLILMDIDLGRGMNGTEAAKLILDQYDIPILFLSSHTEKHIVELTEKITNYGYVVKGSGETVLLTSIKMAFKLFLAKTEALKQETISYETAQNLAITVQSIGDGVIATDINGCVTRMNPVAELLCGWKLEDATGKPLSEVFNIINAKTRQKVDNPVEKVLKTGQKVGLANHTVLVSKDGKEYHIFDSAAPIRNKSGVTFGVVLVFADVTEKYKKEERLRENEERLRFALEGTNDGLWDINIKTDEVYLSPRGCELLGYKPSEFFETVKVWSDLIYEEDRSETNEKLLKYQKKESEIFEVEHRLKTKSGTFKWFLSRGKAVSFDEDGNPLRMTGTHTDISQRKEAEEALKESEQRFRTLVENAPVPLTVARNGVTVYSNIIFAKLLGFDNVEEILEKHLGDYIAPECKAMAREIVQKREKGEDAPKNYEITAMRKTGEKVQVYIQTNRIKMPDGLTYTIASFTDLTEYYKMTEALRQSEERLRFVMEGGNLGFWDWNIETDEVYRNEQWATMLGYTFEELRNTVKQWQDFIHPDDKERAWQSILDLLEGRTKFHKIEYRLQTKSGDYKWIYDRAMITMRNSEGKPIRMSGTHVDITRRKVNEIRLHYYTEELKASNAVKDKFFSIISHDLKGPFMGFLGLTEELANNIDSLEKNDISEVAAVMHNSAKKTYELLNNLLEWSRLQTGRFQYNPEPLDLFSEAEDITRLFSSAVAHKSISIHNNITKNLFVNTDRNALQTILRNLVDNAIKFSNEGGKITINSLRTNGSVQLSVADSGIGMSKDKLEELLNAHSGLTTRGTKGEKGSGLGLSLVQDLVRRCKGELIIKSEENKGTEFIFTLPNSF